MKEINKKTLIEALSTLPEYEPPKAVWQEVEMKIDDYDAADIPSELLEKLPTHQPPASVWNGIEKGLDETPVRRLVPVRTRRAMAVAASLVLLAATFWLMQSPSTIEGEVGELAYSTEELDDKLLAADWDEDEDAFSEFLALCKGKEVICEHPEFQQLKSELEELTEAKEDIKSAMGSFGATADFVTQIKEIELERTDLLKKMMVMLI